jgi:hypothetical protein
MERIETQARLPTSPKGLKEAGNEAMSKVGGHRLMILAHAFDLLDTNGL